MKVKMKLILTSILLIASMSLFAQLKPFLIEGQVVDQNSNPIPDVYIVNLNSHEKDISRANGVFAIWVNPNDTLILSHISYFRETVTVHSLLINPIITMVAEDVNIPEIQISTNLLSDNDRAEKNLEFLNEYEAPGFSKIDVEDDPNPVNEIVTENNELMRSEASSVSIIRFSASESLNILYSKFKKKDPLTNYSSTRKVKKPPVESEEKN